MIQDQENELLRRLLRQAEKSEQMMKDRMAGPRKPKCRLITGYISVEITVEICVTAVFQQQIFGNKYSLCLKLDEFNSKETPYIDVLTT